jgi:hypothetical protein
MLSINTNVDGSAVFSATISFKKDFKLGISLNVNGISSLSKIV